MIRILLLTLMFAPVTIAAQQPAAARPATPPVMVGQKDGFFTTSDGIKIHYLTHGDAGSWVVLVHGYSDNAQRMWFNTGIAPEIAKHHRVVAIDNRNHGQSDKPVPGGSGRAQDIDGSFIDLGNGRLAVYGRTHRACPRCGAAIESARTGPHARGTYWCPRCQPG